MKIMHSIPILFSLFLSSCLSYFVAQESTLEEVFNDREASSILGSTHFPYYMGSDEEYDYYISGGRKYKVKTMATRFFPGTRPFTSWWSEPYVLGLNNGIIMITPFSSMRIFEKHAHEAAIRARQGASFFNKEMHSRYITDLNSWYIRYLGEDRLNGPSLKFNQHPPVMFLINNCGDFCEDSNGDPRFFESSTWNGRKSIQELYSPDNE